jgi:signal recognition particle subunit SRP54
MAFEGLSEKLNGVFKRLKSRGKLSEADVKEAMREVKMALLEADVSYKVVKDFIAKVTERSVGEEVLKSLTPGQQVIKIVNDELIKLMGEANSKINFPNKPPCIIMMCGLQGSGKTTHAAKLAKMFKKEGKRPLLIAADVYRPAAIEQLKVVGERAEVAVFEMGQIDPRKIVKASNSSSFSPIPTNLIGLPVTASTESAAPPLVSESSFVRITLSIPRASSKLEATFTAS